MQSDEIVGDSQESPGDPLPSLPTQPRSDQPCPHGKDYDQCGACVSAVVVRRFVLDRQQDVTGISGTGIILYGVEWYPGGPVDVYWKGTKTTGQYPSMAVVKSTHCYNNNAQVIYLD